MDINVMQTNACAAAAFLKSLANDSRLMILCELLKGERCVAELEEIVSLSQSALSQHLARLRRNHLVKTRRESQTIYYSIADPGVKKIIGALYDLYCGPSKGPEVKKNGNDDRSRRHGICWVYDSVESDIEPAP